MNNLDYDLIKIQLYQLENDFNAKMDKLKKELSVKEEKKIPEKLDIGKMLQTKKWKRDKKTWEAINEIIDYLKNKGE